MTILLKRSVEGRGNVFSVKSELQDCKWTMGRELLRVSSVHMHVFWHSAKFTAFIIPIWVESFKLSESSSARKLATLKY